MKASKLYIAMVLSLFLSLTTYSSSSYSAEGGHHGIQVDLISAVYEGDIGTVMSLVYSGADVNFANVRGFEGKTPLMIASQRGQTAIARFLLEKGARVYAQTSSGSTALAFAALNCNPEIVAMLLARGSNPNENLYPDEFKKDPSKAPLSLMHLTLYSIQEEEGAGRQSKKTEQCIRVVKLLADAGARDSKRLPDSCVISSGGKSALMLMAEHGHMDTVKTLLGNDSDINACDLGGMTPLMYALKYPDPNIPRILIEHKADVNAVTTDGETPLMVALVLNRPESARLLIDSGAKIDAVDSKGATMLMYASMGGNLDLVKLVWRKESGVDKTNYKGLTALMYSPAGGNPDVAEWLISKGAGVNLKDGAGLTALMYSAREGKPQIAKVLIKHGADVNMKSNGGLTALMVSAEFDQPDVARILLTAGANPDAVDSNKTNALMYASSKGGIETLRLLLPATKNVNAHDNEGWTPLLLVAKSGGVKEAGLLLDNGALVNSITFSGTTAVMIAASGNRTDMLELLFSKGASVSATNKFGWNAVHFAARTGSKKSLALLSEKGADMTLLDASGNSPLYYAAVNQKDDAVEFLMPYIKHDTDYQGLSRFYFKKGDYDSALKNIDKAISMKDSVSIKHGMRAETLIKTGDLKGSKASFEKAYSLTILSLNTKKESDDYISLVWYALFLSKFDEGAEYAKQGLSAFPDVGMINANLGHIYLVLGDSKKAIIEYRIYLDKNKNTPESQEALLDDFDLLKGVFPEKASSMENAIIELKLKPAKAVKK